MKPPDRGLQTAVTSRQARNYLERYGKVLAATLRRRRTGRFLARR